MQIINDLSSLKLYLICSPVLCVGKLQGNVAAPTYNANLVSLLNLL